MMLDLERKMETKFRDYGGELKREIAGVVDNMDTGGSESLTLARRLAQVEEYQQSGVTSQLNKMASELNSMQEKNG
jgi:hypothetical protein